jgi:hypothetical protein
MNNSFDNQISDMIVNENFDVPEKFKVEIRFILENLPESNEGLKKEKKGFNKVKIILIASIVTLLLTATAFATVPELLKMTQNLIENFTKINNIDISSKREEYEKYNASVNYTSESEGISVTIENIAVDGNFLLMTSKVTSPEKIEDVIKNSRLYKEVVSGRKELNIEAVPDYEDFLFAISPNYLFEINGEDCGIFDLSEWEDYITDDYSFVSIQKYIIPVETDDIFNLSIRDNHICYVRGDWNFKTIIDKSAVNEDTVTASPNIKAAVTSIENGEEYKHYITIEKLSISPFGGQITLSEKGTEVFRDFVLRDDEMNYYTVLNESVTVSGPDDISRNSFEFIAPKSPVMLKELELVPVFKYEAPVEQTVMLEEDIISTDIKLSKIGGYKIEDMDIDGNEIKIILNPYGAILQYRSIINGSFGFVDKEGSKNINKYISIKEVRYDKTNGNAVITGAWDEKDAGKILEQIGGFWYVNMQDMELNEKEAIKIQLK